MQECKQCGVIWSDSNSEYAEKHSYRVRIDELSKQIKDWGIISSSPQFFPIEIEYLIN